MNLVIPQAPLLPPIISSFVSISISFLSSMVSVLFHIFLFLLALWVLVSLYCYVVEVIIWCTVERHSQNSPESLTNIMIPDPDLRFKLKIAAVQTGIWLYRMITRKFKRVSEEKKVLSQQELPIQLPQISYKTSATESIPIECAICLDDCVDDASCRAFPVCNHIFHSQCIDQWLKHQLNCPVCRNDIIDVPDALL